MKRRIATDLLEQWGIWVHQHTGVPRHVSPMLAIMRRHAPSVHGSDAAITDDDAMEVSAILARLRSRGELLSPRYRGVDMYDLIYDRYALCLSLEAVASEMKINRQQARDMQTSAEGYVQAALDMIDAMEVGMRNRDHYALQC